ncbi:MAG: hypothetical protein AAFV85_26905 [Cyanobacteria bacterium J06634_6]
MSQNPLKYFYFFKPQTAVALTAVGLLVGAPALDSPAASQAHSLVASGLVTTPVLDAAGVNPGLNADGLNTGSPEVGIPAVTQRHSLSGAGLVTGSPAIGEAPLEGQLIANGLATTPQLGQGGLTQLHNLIGSGLVTNTPSLETSELSQTTPGADGLVIGAPILGIPTSTQQQALVAEGLATGAPILDTANENSGVAFICPPELTIEKQLDGSELSPSADLRLKITLIRISDDINPVTSLATDYTDALPSLVFYRCGSLTPIATLTLDSGMSLATNDAATQVYTALLEQSVIASYRDKELRYRFTVETADGALVSGDSSEENYTGEFKVARY